MSQNNNNNSGNPPVAPKVSWATKVGYMGTGVLVGLVIYPFVRKTIGKLQPKVDQLFDELTGKAENFAERASDILARAKESVYRKEKEVKSEATAENALKQGKRKHKHNHDEDSIQ